MATGAKTREKCFMGFFEWNYRILTLLPDETNPQKKKKNTHTFSLSHTQEVLARPGASACKWMSRARVCSHSYWNNLVPPLFFPAFSSAKAIKRSAASESDQSESAHNCLARNVKVAVRLPKCFPCFSICFSSHFLLMIILIDIGIIF